MGRLGAAAAGSAAAGTGRLPGRPSLRFAGIYTHFARALEKDERPARKQFAVFQQVLADLERAGINPGLRHCANSAALVRFPEMRLDAVRPGTILYGQYPSAAVPRSLDLQETWRMQARVVAVRDVPAGSASRLRRRVCHAPPDQTGRPAARLCRRLHRRPGQRVVGLARPEKPAAPVTRHGHGSGQARPGRGPRRHADLHGGCHRHSRRRASATLSRSRPAGSRPARACRACTKNALSDAILDDECRNRIRGVDQSVRWTSCHGSSLAAGFSLLVLCLALPQAQPNVTTYARMTAQLQADAAHCPLLRVTSLGKVRRRA